MYNKFVIVKRGFTLAEVLIALVVIGIIAAITLTTVMPNIQERANSQRQANIVYKVTQATNLMKANGAMVNGFESTDKFVDELQKYLKIMKRCDSEHIADCWPTKKVITSDGEEFEVSKAKTRENLGFKDNYKNNKNVGIVLADGASIIMTYNPANVGLKQTDPLTSQTTILPVGGRFQTFLEYTSNTTAGLAFVMDVNGSKGPNKEKDGTTHKLYDIRALNSAQFSTGCTAKVDGKCYKIFESPTSFSCADNPTNEFCTKENASGYKYPYYSTDYWVGAQIDCASVGGKMPTPEELYEICQNSSLRENLGLTDFRGRIWADGLHSSYAYLGRMIGFEGCGDIGIDRKRTDVQALCISE